MLGVPHDENGEDDTRGAAIPGQRLGSLERWFEFLQVTHTWDQ